MLRNLLTALLLLSQTLSPQTTVRAQSSVQFSGNQVQYIFGNEIRFSVQAAPPEAIQDVYVFIQPQGEESRVGKAEIDEKGLVRFVYPVPVGSIRPFSKVTYWFTATRQDQEIGSSPVYSFEYEDNRFTWQSLNDSVFIVHWYNGDLVFGQEVLNTAEAGLTSAQNLIAANPPAPVNIYVYASAEDLQSSLQLGGINWVAGHASPDQGIVMVSIPNGADWRLNLERQIPHEIAHILLYASSPNGYAKLPTWLDEGVASLSELYQSPEYQRALDIAKANNALISIEDLCQDFPRSAASKFLAYAEAASFTQFVVKNYGISGLGSLIRAYTDGLGCDAGVTQALNISLGRLDFRWRQESLGVQAAGLVFANLAPFFILLGVFLAAGFIPLVWLFRHK